MTIKELLAARRKVRVLVVGDIMLDQYTAGAVQRISPEAPVPVLAFKEEHFVLGGAANVAANLASLDVNVDIFGVVGKDHWGNFLREKMKRHHIRCDHVISDERRHTTTKQRVTSGQQIVRIDRETVKPINDWQVNETVRRFKRFLPYAKAVIISDYGKGVITPALLTKIVTACVDRGVYVSINVKPHNKVKPSGVNLVTVNRREAFELSGVDDNGSQECLHMAARAIHRLYNPRTVLITLGPEGMLIYRHTPTAGFEADEKILHIPTAAKEVADVSGAGDTVIACYTLAAALGCDSVVAARFANKAAGIVVGKSGTAVVKVDELRRAS